MLNTVVSREQADRGAGLLAIDKKALPSDVLSAEEEVLWILFFHFSF